MANAKKIKLECQVDIDSNEPQAKRNMSDIPHTATEVVQIKTEIDIGETEIKGEIEEVVDVAKEKCGTSNESIKCVGASSKPIKLSKNNVYAGFCASRPSQVQGTAAPLVMLVPMQEYLVDSIEVLKKKHAHAEKELRRLGRENKKISNYQKEIVHLRKENQQLIRRLSNMCSINLNRLLVMNIRTELMQVKREVMEIMKECKAQSPSEANDDDKRNLRSTSRSTNDRVKLLRETIKEKVKKCFLLEKRVKQLRARTKKNV